MASECERLKQHQIMYKAKTPPWKDAFRERCVQRLRSNRSRLVDKFRGLVVEADETIEVVMKEEWESLSSKENDMPRIFKIDYKESDDAEVNEYISILEEIQQELIEEEKRIIEEYFAELEAENINSTVDWLERNEVICPLCKKLALHQNLSVIFCGCGFRIDTQQDGFTLDNFKQQLHEGLDTHEKTCSFSPTFSVLQYCSYANLTITCEKIAHLPGVVKVLDFLVLDIKYYIVTEFVEGDLFEFTQNCRLSEIVCKIIFKQIFETVVKIHRAGVFHGDLKLENILCDSRTFTTEIIDFGNVNIYRPGYLDKFHGTTEYCPPEWLMYNIHESEATTIWTLGVML